MRNCRIFEGKSTQATLVFDSTVTLVQEFNSITGKEMSNRPTATGVNQWNKPDVRFVKVNCDASLNSRGCGLGYIGRNERGEVAFFCGENSSR